MYHHYHQRKLLFYFIINFSLLSWQAHAFNMPQTVSWDRLQSIQQDSLLSAQALGLALRCPKSVTGKPSGIYMQNILYNNYHWQEYDTYGGKCLVLIVDQSSTAASDIQPIKQFLTLNQAQVLLSAGRGIGFEAKGYFAEAEQAQQQLEALILNGKQADCSSNQTQDYVQKNSQTSEACSPTHKAGDDFGAFFEGESFNFIGDIFANGIGDNRDITPTTQIPYVFEPQISTRYTALGGAVNRIYDHTSGTYVTPFSVLTVAHAIARTDNEFNGFSPRGYMIRTPLGREFTEVSRVRRHPQSSTIPNQAFEYDYGAIQMAMPYIFPLFRPVDLSNHNYQGHESFEISGWPLITYFSGNPAANFSGNPTTQPVLRANAYKDEGPVNEVLSNNTPRILVTELFSSRGVSGAPVVATNDPDHRVSGVQVAVKTVSPNDHSELEYTIAVDFDENDVNFLQQVYSFAPTGFLDIQLHPNSVVNYDILSLPTFAVNFIPFQTRNLGSVNPENIEWISSIDGLIANGESIDPDNLRSQLTVGTHELMISIDDGVDNATRSVMVEVTGPSGELNVPDFCAVNLRFPAGNTCDAPITWSTVDVPENMTPVVINTVIDAEVASGVSGSANVTVGTTPTTLTLHESSEQILTLDEASTQAQIPTGQLSSNLSTCAIEPTHSNNNPQGCDVTLNWSNVRYANPRIYYRHANGSQWFPLGNTINCGAGPCSGSINTADISSGLIDDEAGRVFELKQFNCNDDSCSNTGTIGQAVPVNGIKFADDYEFDNTLDRANLVALGDIQNNHSFHKPAPQYGLEDTDVDTYLLNRPQNMGEQEGITVETFNIANGLQTDLSVQCYGEGLVTPANGEPSSTGRRAFALRGNHQTQTVSGNEPGSVRLSWNAIRSMRWTQSGNHYQVFCDGYVVVAERVAGQPSAELTYSIGFNESNQGPVFTGNTNGFWHNSNREGEGWAIEKLPGDKVGFYWLTYPPVGQFGLQRWLIGVGNVMNNRYVFDRVTIGRGARFGAAFDSNDIVVENWGAVEIVFSDNNNAVLNYSSFDNSYGSGSIAITKLSQVHTGSVSGPLSAGISGNWFDQSTEGEGWGIQILSSDKALVYWYTYDNIGQRAWNGGVADIVGNQIILNDSKYSHGLNFGDDFNSDDHIREHFGGLNITFHDCDRASLSFQTLWGNGNRQLRRLTRIVGVPSCEPF